MPSLKFATICSRVATITDTGKMMYKQKSVINGASFTHMEYINSYLTFSPISRIQGCSVLCSFKSVSFSEYQVIDSGSGQRKKWCRKVF